MSSFKQLNKADVTTVPYAANKYWALDDSDGFNNDKINLFKGTYVTGTFSPLSQIFNQQYKRLIYDNINHMFYQSYSGSLLDTGSLMFNVNTYESASQQRPTGSYFDYNTNFRLVKNFPTGSGAKITTLIINPQVYGSKILPTTFKIELDLVNEEYAEVADPPIISDDIAFVADYDAIFLKIKIIDDGYGNLYDVGMLEDDYVLPTWPTVDYFYDNTPSTEPTHIGNIFYAHGIIIITNPDYQNIFSDIEYLSTEMDDPIITESNINFIK